MINLLTLIISFIVLLWSANQLVVGASGVAHYKKWSSLLTGFTLVALGTSAPEIIVAITASLNGTPDIAIGNAIGTNIANIGLVLGVTTLLKPLKIHSTLLTREYPLLFLIMLFSYSIMMDGYLSILDGCFCLIACLALIAYFIFSTRQHRTQHQLTLALQKATLSKHSFNAHLFRFLLGLVLLPLSAKFLVNSSVALGHWLGMDELTMGLTLVAIGTSLPELMTSIVAALKGADDIAIGNILGSNMFNLLAVIIFPSMIHPAAISHALLWRDIPAMFLTTIILFWMNYRSKKRMARWQGGVLLFVYGCYIVSLVISASK